MGEACLARFKETHGAPFLNLGALMKVFRQDLNAFGQGALQSSIAKRRRRLAGRFTDL